MDCLVGLKEASTAATTTYTITNVNSMERPYEYSKMGELEIGLKQKLKEKTKLGVMLVGFICSCGLYEFGGVFWMTYFNPYLQTAVGLSSGDIGTIVLVAQITDAIANPSVGILIEHLKIPLFGKKRGCHLIGSILMTTLFPLLWMNCSFCNTELSRVVYYGIVAAVLNSITPFMFLPHLSMIALLAKNEKQRLIFGGISSFGKQFWGILAYSTMWLLIGTDKNDENLGQLLGEKLKIASYVVSGIGVICTIVFHASVWNLDENKTDAITDTDGGVPSKSSMISDLKTVAKNPNFYILGLLYFVCRSELSLYNVYQVFFFEQTLGLPKEAVAYLPFIYLSFAGIGSIAVKPIVKKLKPMPTFGLAILAVIIAGIAIMLQPKQYGNVVILPVIFVSVGSAIMYTLSLSLTSSLIVRLRVSDVAVWGAFNLIDRILFGVLFVVVQEFRPCPTSKSCCEACSDFYRYVFGGGLVLFALLAAALILSTRFTGDVFATSRGEDYQTKDSDKNQLKLEEVVENPIVDKS
ncbi:major facilitator superfamily domain-containing protein 12-like isoform X2 [Bolinopsis microptera]|uniref:major facilitator superfamily domain-containing protein 12-like isoform X2 n=1 Tax=Bolinopsis microptera TaxID=2820187 RepID=UPI00307AB4C8